MKNLDLYLRKSVGSRPANVSVDQSLRSSLDRLSNQIDLLESWDSVYACSTSRFVNIEVIQFVDFDGHVSATTIPDNFIVMGGSNAFYR